MRNKETIFDMCGNGCEIATVPDMRCRLCGVGGTVPDVAITTVRYWRYGARCGDNDCAVLAARCRICGAGCGTYEVHAESSLPSSIALS